MDQHDAQEPPKSYPTGRGYGADYMRGGEVLGGYGYSARDDYQRPRGEAAEQPGPVGAGEADAPASDEQPGS